MMLERIREWLRLCKRKRNLRYDEDGVPHYRAYPV